MVLSVMLRWLSGSGGFDRTGLVGLALIELVKKWHGQDWGCCDCKYGIGGVAELGVVVLKNRGCCCVGCNAWVAVRAQFCMYLCWGGACKPLVGMVHANL